MSFLTNSFNTLEENNYGYSITNSWEHYKKDDNIVVIEMNFTRFLKDSTIMGAKNRTATYILSLKLQVKRLLRKLLDNSAQEQ